ncbi:uncharacterized protein BcabD6B2_35730 [Babesia caballi]|uniref:Uncharacterized protein n=1 Tax=Babesia caballi TaxID=5871 RepID=A0AAV4LVD7_BABCB|nr:hypothetical protein, conserved [Babesia caballi]
MHVALRLQLALQHAQAPAAGGKEAEVGAAAQRMDGAHVGVAHVAAEIRRAPVEDEGLVGDWLRVAEQRPQLVVDQLGRELLDQA